MLLPLINKSKNGNQNVIRNKILTYVDKKYVELCYTCCESIDEGGGGG
jgi:hypothetical protein